MQRRTGHSRPPSFHARFFQGDAGFTLIELMLVVAIIGILAALAVPQILGFATKAKQSEAKELLATVYTAEKAYFGEHNSYGTLGQVGFMPSSTPKYYTNILANFSYTGGTSFTGSCSANIDRDATLDIWEVTEGTRGPVNSTNDVKS